jgi:hypothetical protein
MKNKVTSYSLSKQLADAGFDSENYCGWWVYWDEEWIYTEHDVEMKCTDSKTGEAVDASQFMHKAYDCFDLLMWLKVSIKNYERFDFWFTEPGYNFCTGTVNITRRDFKSLASRELPQEALGQAVLKVVQGD